jgi:hypothetical protein
VAAHQPPKSCSQNTLATGHPTLTSRHVSRRACRACRTSGTWTTGSSWFLLQMTKWSTHAKAALQSLMALSGLSMWCWNGPAFLKPKGILLYSNRPKGVNLGEHRASGRLGIKVLHVWQQVDIRLCQEVELPEISTGPPAPIHLPHHVKWAGPENVE